MRHPFLAQAPPKSTGREEFGVSLAMKIARQAKENHIADEDVLHTVTEYTACSIAQNCRSFLPGAVDKVWICGGGAINRLLMGLLQDSFSPVAVKSSAEFGVDPDALEAMGFAYLAYRTIKRLPGNIPSVTGAREAVVLGKIIPANRAGPGAI